MKVRLHQSRYLLILLSFFLIPAFAQQQGTFESSGSQLFYRTFGSGTPLVIINGGPGMDSEGFTDLAKLLAAHNETIIYDQRGTGRSVVPVTDSTTITMDLMIEDLENLRKHLGFKQWIVMGHSFGGMLASYYATKHPDHILGMILSSSGGIDLELMKFAGNEILSRLTVEQLDSVNYWSHRIDAGDTTYHARLHRGLALANAYLYNKEYVPLIAERLTHSNFAVNGLVFGDLQRIHYDCAPGLKAFNKPVLIIQGKQDIVRADMAEKAHDVLKNSKMVFLDHCVHYGWLDAREEYLKDVGDFLASLD